MADGFRSFLAFWMGGGASSYPDGGALLIAGENRTEYIKAETGRFRRAFNQRSQFTCTIEDRGRGYVPETGSELLVLLDGVRLFGGLITKVTGRLHPKHTYAVYDVEATDFNVIADKRLVYYAGFIGVLTVGPGYAGDLIRAIATAALTGESVDSTSEVDQGPLIESPLTFFYENVTTAFNKISQISGYRWRIDEYRVLHFSNFTGDSAAFNITENASDYRADPPIQVTRELTNYRNTQYERTESTLVGSDTETFTGDGTTADFFVGIDPVTGNAVRFIINGPPVVTLNAVPLSVGRLGFDIDPSSFDCVYDVGGVGIHFSTLFGHTIPPAASTLSVTYDYVAGNVISVEDSAEILARQAIEGGSGIWEHMDEQRNIASLDTLTSIAEGNLTQYGLVPTTIEYETDAQGLDPGAIQTITLPSLGVSGDYLIEQIDSEWITGASFEFRHRVRATDVGPMTQPAFATEKLNEVARIGVPRASPVLTDIAGSGSGGVQLIGRQSDGTSPNFLFSSTNNTPLNASNGPWTISFWIKVNGLSQTDRYVLMMGDVGGTTGWRIDFGNVASSLRFVSTGGSGSDPTPSSDILISDGNWRHICYRKSASGAAAWDKFVDGIRTSISSSINFTLGGGTHTWAFDDRADQGNYFKGSLAEIAIWNVALTNGQITQLAALFAADVVHPAGLLNYWRIVGDSPEGDDGSNNVTLSVNGTLPSPG